MPAAFQVRERSTPLAGNADPQRETPIVVTYQRPIVLSRVQQSRPDTYTRWDAARLWVISPAESPESA